MIDSTLLRNLAETLRSEAIKQADLRKVKAANILIAATGLGLLNRKLGGI